MGRAVSSPGTPGRTLCGCRVFGLARQPFAQRADEPGCTGPAQALRRPSPRQRLSTLPAAQQAHGLGRKGRALPAALLGPRVAIATPAGQGTPEPAPRSVIEAGSGDPIARVYRAADPGSAPQVSGLR